MVLRPFVAVSGNEEESFRSLTVSDWEERTVSDRRDIGGNDMSENNQSLQEILFELAVQKPTEAERAAFLDPPAGTTRRCAVI